MLKLFLAVLYMLLAFCAHAEDAKQDYVLGAGDMVRVIVYNSPDLATETRVTAAGTMTFPLLGEVAVGGITAGEAEKKIAAALESGGFLKQPQINLVVLQYQSQLVSVLGDVNKPGRYPLDRPSRLTDVMAMAGGVTSNGSEIVSVNSARDGKSERHEYDLREWFIRGQLPHNPVIRGGDIIYVPRAPLFYIYGEVQRPGVFRMERNMTVAQALAVGGGLNVRGTERGILITRRDAGGVLLTIKPKSSDTLQADDVIYVRESLF